MKQAMIDKMKEALALHHNGRPVGAEVLFYEVLKDLQSLPEPHPEIINWLDYESSDHVLAWFLVEAMSHAPDGGIERFGSFDSSKLEVEVRVNGVTVPFVSTMAHLQGQLKQIQEEGAREKLAPVLESVMDLGDAINLLRRDLGLGESQCSS